MIILFTCIVALLIVSTVFALYDRASFLHAKSDDLSAAADMIGLNSTAALTFHDRKSAREGLNALQAKQQVIHACVYDLSGKVFATYNRNPADQSFSPPPVRDHFQQVTGRRMILFQDITMNARRFGTIFIEADLRDLDDRTLRFAMIGLGALLGSLAIAFLLSFRLQSVISGPIQQLADTASSISAAENYSLRARKAANDEIGVLFDQFNGMLDRIEQRDAALQNAHDDLERRVAERTAYLNALIEASPLAIMVLSPDDCIQLCNPAFEKLFHYSRQEVLGKSIRGLLAAGDLLEEAEELRRQTRSGKHIQLVTTRQRKDGTLVDVEVHTVRLVVEGQTKGTLILYQDISARKRSEEAMQQAKEAAEAASQAKSEFLANMSHEIRTPLNGVMGMTHLALGTELNSEQREYLETVKSSADSLLVVINGILDFSKVEAGKAELDICPFKLRDALDAALKTMSLRALEKGLKFTLDFAPEIPETVLGDSNKLSQVVLNLVGNALKFTHQGQVSLRAEVTSRTADLCLLHFTVSDTGIGISTEKHKLIFDPFAQADTSTTRKYGGTGLGLTISKRLVHLMGGDIWLESDIGQGARFHFTVRLASAESSSLQSIRTQSPATRHDPVHHLAVDDGRLSSNSLHVLLVEDNLVNQRLASRMLEKRGHRVEVAGNGREALEALERAPFDLVFMDVQMPEMDGFEATAAIRAKETNSSAHLPIIALTAHAMAGYREKCLAAGMDNYLTKPLQPSELDTVLDSYLVTPMCKL
jgi:PAS domain S-box-containing protein